VTGFESKLAGTSLQKAQASDKLPFSERFSSTRFVFPRTTGLQWLLLESVLSLWTQRVPFSAFPVALQLILEKYASFGTLGAKRKWLFGG
jgi:hypothetical protein